MSNLYIDCVGYFALVINLISMSANGEYKLRILSLIANIIYIFYGILLGAVPVIIGCIIAVFLHGYHVRKLRVNNCL